MFRTRRGKITVSLTDREAGLLRGLIGEYLEVLDTQKASTSSGAIDPSDKERVMQRLFPEASLDDERVRAEYSQLARDSLEHDKRTNAQTALRSLGPAGPWKGTLSSEERDSWLVILTDLRLVIGTRLDVTEETMSIEPDPNDPQQWPIALLHYLGWLQETLVEASNPG